MPTPILNPRVTEIGHAASPSRPQTEGTDTNSSLRPAPFSRRAWRDALADQTVVQNAFGESSEAKLLDEPAELMYVGSSSKVTHMIKTQVYLRKEELDALRMAAARSGRSVAELVRDAIRKTVLKPQAAGPVAIWDGEPKRASIEHDSVHDER